jgi:DNA polymerase-3 subunit alpha
MSFVHLHVHSTYSLLDGFSDIKKLVAATKSMGMDSIALTDHGTMFGSIEFYNAARAAGIKPIIGLEAYLSARGMTDRDSKLDKHSNHMLLLAQNEVGYHNLLQIASAAQVEGFYYFPRIDRDYLAKHAEGLIATSGCMAAEIPRAIMAGDMDIVRKKLDWYYDVFGKDNFFLELQEHNIAELPGINKALLGLGERYQARYVATNDVHYINQEDSKLQDVLLAVQTGTTLRDPNRMRMGDNSYYLRTPEEMARIFSEVPEAISNTQLIADRCSIDLERKSYHLPLFEVPDGFTSETYLRHLCEEGFIRRYGVRVKDPKVRDRLEYELGIIHKMGFDTYFLIVSDLCRFARQEGVWYNARGSAAGSMVAYTLDITLVEPIDHGLIFERFLNPGRNEMPDIDLDFQDDKRARIMEYCANKYGSDKVAQIITFGTMGARAALRDVGRVMEIPLSEVDRVAKMINIVPNKATTLMEAMKDSPELQQLYDDVDYIKELVDTASKMEGTVRNAGTHAAGVIISDKPIVEYAPLHRPTNGSEESPIKSVMQYEMSHVDKLGLLKVDFLGLATLTVMQRACKLIKERHGITFDLSNIPTDDPATYEFIGKGHTAGMFQLEGNGMTRWIVQMKPKTLANVIAMVALFRPGPMEFIPQYIRRMHGEESVEYKHPALESIMKETYGIAVYQEQVMSAAIQMANYTPSEADNLRSAISKKKAEAIAKHRKMFIDGCVKNDIAEETARAIFEEWENFARYGFNKSHAADYGVIAVQTGYLKTHYTVEYMTALLSAVKNETEKVAFYATDCRSMGIDVLPPDINSSGWDFTIEDRKDKTSAIRFGLGAVKNVGVNPVEAIIAGRENGTYKDLTDLAMRLDLRTVSKRPLESLIKVGALDGFGPRCALLQSLDRIINVSAAHFRAKDSGQLSFFGGDTGVSEVIHLPTVKEPDRKELLAWEKELIGLYVSAHPLTPYLPVLIQKTTHLIGQLGDLNSGEKVAIGGIVVKLRPHFTKDGKPMGFVTIEDVQGEIELVLFPRVWEKYVKMIKVESVLVVEGKVDNASATPKLLADKFELVQLDDVQNLPPPTAIEITPVKTESIIEPIITNRTNGEHLGMGAVAVNTEIEMDPAVFFFDDNWVPDADQENPPILDEYSKTFEVADSMETAVVAGSTPEEIQQENTELLELDHSAGLVLPEFQISTEPILNPSANDTGTRMISVILRSTHDQEKDVRRMKSIQGLMQSSPGKDHFSFHIIEDGRRCLIEFPNHTTGITPSLLNRLEKLVGKENYRIDPIIVH